MDWETWVAKHARRLLFVSDRLLREIDGLDSETPGEGRNLFVSPGCIVCTSGATPDRWNKGLCAYHEADFALREAMRDLRPVKPSSPAA